MQPTSPDPQFDFMLKNSPPPKRGLPLPNLNLPKPVKLIIGVVIGLLLLVIILSAFSKRGGLNSQPILSVMARSQEITRVTELTDTQYPLQDPTAQALAATVNTALSSDQQQLSSYLSSNNIKVSELNLSSKIDKSTDDKLQTASQNNNLESTYENYLRTSLADYAQALKTAYDSAGPKAKVILKNAYDSTNTLLSSPPLKS